MWRSSLCIQPPLWSSLSEDLDVSFVELNNSFVLQQAGIALGCLLSIPFALKFGRRPVYLLAATLVLGTNIWQAKQSVVGDLYGANFLSGLAGSANEAMVQITVHYHRFPKCLPFTDFQVDFRYLIRSPTWKYACKLYSNDSHRGNISLSSVSVV
jgi:hypothetical protein